MLQSYANDFQTVQETYISTVSFLVVVFKKPGEWRLVFTQEIHKVCATDIKIVQGDWSFFQITVKLQFKG